MARMIRHEKNAPYEVAEGTELPIIYLRVRTLEEQAVLRRLA